MKRLQGNIEDKKELEFLCNNPTTNSYKSKFFNNKE